MYPNAQMQPCGAIIEVPLHLAEFIPMSVCIGFRGISALRHDMASALGASGGGGVGICASIAPWSGNSWSTCSLSAVAKVISPEPGVGEPR